jgi:hypothetical protein
MSAAMDATLAVRDSGVRPSEIVLGEGVAEAMGPWMDGVVWMVAENELRVVRGLAPRGAVLVRGGAFEAVAAVEGIAA